MHLHVLGSVNLDLICQVDALPRPGETVLARAASAGQGGKGANQAKAAARFGAEVSFHGAVGADEAGAALRAGLVGEGIEVKGLAAHPGVATGRAHVFVGQDGENMIVVDAGANRLARFEAASASEPCVYLTQMETPVEVAAHMFAGAAPGSVCIFNAAPALPEGRVLLPLADIVVVNRRELAAYAGEGGDAAQAARRLLTRGGQTIVVTLGAAGALAVAAGIHVEVAGRPTRAVDTTGAGDCFVGVLAAALASEVSLEAALDLANAAASLSVETLGADSAPPLRDILARRGQANEDA
jgi:ribokinase